MTEYQREIERLYRFLVPAGARVLEVGCGQGHLLNAVKPASGMGIDISSEAVARAKEQHPDLTFSTADAETLEWPRQAPFDYIILSDLVPEVRDVQNVMSRLRRACQPATRLIVNYHSNLWKPIMTLAAWLGLRKKKTDINWLSTADVLNLLRLSGFEPVIKGGRILLPLGIPLLSWIFNRLLDKIPLFHQMCLTWYVVARPIPEQPALAEKPSVSVVIPTRNEKGNIEKSFQTIPAMGKWTELIFVDGHSTDGTIEEIERCIKLFGSAWKRVSLLRQSGLGKGAAVRQAFEACEGDILMVLDSDLTMPPEELPKYYDAMVSGAGEFVNGSRLVYPMGEKSMRFLNMVFNHLFALLFSWLLGQRVKDTLCGTKALWRRDYLQIQAHRSYFGDFDPFGDFDLLFGAAKLNRAIVDMPIRYRPRTYGEIKINRWRDGFLLLRMSLIAFRRFKLS